MAFEHADFWLVAGTAAPVLALASAVAAGNTVRGAVTSRRRGEPGQSLPSRDTRRRYFGSWLLALIGFVADIAVLILALGSLLASNDNTVTVAATFTLLVVSIVSVGLQAVAGAIAETALDED